MPLILVVIATRGACAVSATEYDGVATLIRRAHLRSGKLMTTKLALVVCLQTMMIVYHPLLLRRACPRMMMTFHQIETGPLHLPRPCACLQMIRLSHRGWTCLQT